MTAESLWRCEICGYVHQGHAAPDRCPVCFAGPEAFTLQGAAPDPPPPALAQGTLLIVGGGGAGLAAAQEARRVAPGAEILLLAGEGLPPYSRLDLTRYLAGEIAADRLPLQPPRWYTENRIEVRVGQALAVDRPGRRVRLREGGTLAYERLILATGAHPHVPALPGLHSPRVFRLRTLADADALLLAARPGSRALCLGGGLLGLECAAALARRSCSVRVLESASCLLPRQLAPGGGDLLREHLASLGVETTLEAKPREVRDRGDRLEIHFAEGETICAEFMVVAAGIVPETYLARESGLQVGRGILVDDTLATSDPAIFACGDVAEHRGVLYGLWEAARAQGVVAGASAAGAQASFQGLPATTFLKVVGLEVFSCGVVAAQGEGFDSREARLAGSWQRLVWSGKRLVGAQLVGAIQAAGLLKTAIEEGWDAWRLGQELTARGTPPSLAPRLLAD